MRKLIQSIIREVDVRDGRTPRDAFNPALVANIQLRAAKWLRNQLCLNSGSFDAMEAELADAEDRVAAAARDEPTQRPEAVIAQATIGPLPKSMLDPMPRVTAVFTDGTTRDLFDFFPDEVSFTEDELLGLTEQGARELKGKKDLAHLQS